MEWNDLLSENVLLFISYWSFNDDEVKKVSGSNMILIAILLTFDYKHCCNVMAENLFFFTNSFLI